MKTAPQILVITGSARHNSDTKFYADIVFSGMQATHIELLDYSIARYSYTADYPPHDDFEKLVGLVLQHQVIVFATPVYWYVMSGNMKIFFDRLNDLVTIRKQQGRMLKGKSVCFLAVASDPELPPGFEIPFRLTAEYLDMQYKGCIYFSTKDGRLNQQQLSPEKTEEIKVFVENMKQALS